MPNYLERYQQGEYVQVWKELVAAGDAVRTEPLYTDARAVAQETMRRAKHNIDLLIERLQKIGYDFQSPRSILVPATSQQLANMDKFEQNVGPVPLSLRAWIETVGAVNLMGTYPRLSHYHSGPHVAVMGNQQMGIGDMLAGLNMDDLEHVPGPLPGIIKNMQKLGIFPSVGKDAKKTPQEEPKIAVPDEDRIESDPLVVEPYFMGDAYEYWEDADEGPFMAAIAPDIFHKANISGGDGQEIHLPDAAADAPLHHTEWGKLTFVEYLRLSFEWAGFPGLQEYERRDEALLTSLKEGLLPL